MQESEQSVEAAGPRGQLWLQLVESSGLYEPKEAKPRRRVILSMSWST